jgi:putative ABC transport system permease protein
MDVTVDFFDVLGAPAALGRTFSGTTNAPGGERVVVLSDAAWQDLVNRDRGVIGRRIRVNGAPCTVVAVMPKEFEWPEGAGVWLLSQKPVPPAPLEIKEADPLTNRDTSYFDVVARVKPGVSLAQAQQDLHAIASTLQREHPAEDGGRDVRLVPVRVDLASEIRHSLIVIQGAVGLVLLVACANVSSLLIARGTGRRRELTIRATLGASRRALVGQLLVESLVLGAAGGLLGLLASTWLVRVLVTLLPQGLPRVSGIDVDVVVVTVTFVASLVASVLFGILPALHVSRVDAAQALKQGGDRGSTRTRGRAALVAGEIALTLVLLAGAGLLANSFLRLQRVDPGFTVEHATVADLMLSQARYQKEADQTRLYRALLEQLATRPELRAYSIGFPGPLHGDNAHGTFQLENGRATSPGDMPYANIASVSGGYFAAMGIPLIAGRSFDDRDRGSSVPAAIVNAAFAKKYWPGGAPIDKRLRFGEHDPWIQIVGVVADTRQLGLNQPPPPLLYVPYDFFVLPFTTVAVRTALPHPAVVSLLKAQLAAVDPDLAFADIKPLKTEILSSLASERFFAALIGAFALLALALASVGVSGLISYTVTQRTREIGIRIALGASPRQVLAMILRQGLAPALVGIGAGLAGAVFAMRLLEAFLFGIGTADPVTLAAVALLLLIVAAAATYVPSRRALRVDPVVALRAE